MSLLTTVSQTAHLCPTTASREVCYGVWRFFGELWIGVHTRKLERSMWSTGRKKSTRLSTLSTVLTGPGWQLHKMLQQIPCSTCRTPDGNNSPLTRAPIWKTEYAAGADGRRTYRISTQKVYQQHSSGYRSVFGGPSLASSILHLHSTSNVFICNTYTSRSAPNISLTGSSRTSGTSLTTAWQALWSTG